MISGKIQKSILYFLLIVWDPHNKRAACVTFKPVRLNGIKCSRRKYICVFLTFTVKIIIVTHFPFPFNYWLNSLFHWFIWDNSGYRRSAHINFSKIPFYFDIKICAENWSFDWVKGKW